MIIDIHQHITYTKYPQFAKHGPFTGKDLLNDMDKWGIDKSVVLPLINPENIDILGIAGNQEVIDVCQQHPDRLIPFCNIDPRCMMNHENADFSVLMKKFKDFGCRGIGEVCANIPINSRLYKNLFYHAGKEGLPIIFHLSPTIGGVYGMVDEPGIPGLEEVLKEFSGTIFIGHAPSFWNEIDANLKAKDRNMYPAGTIEKEGRLWFLMEKYPNLYGDISAGSGYNALTRDPEAGIRFINKFNKKIFFGTDMFFSKDTSPKHLVMMKNMLDDDKISKSVYKNIMYRNYERVF